MDQKDKTFNGCLEMYHDEGCKPEAVIRVDAAEAEDEDVLFEGIMFLNDGDRLTVYDGDEGEVLHTFRLAWDAGAGERLPEGWDKEAWVLLCTHDPPRRCRLIRPVKSPWPPWAEPPSDDENGIRHLWEAANAWWTVGWRMVTALWRHWWLKAMKRLFGRKVRYEGVLDFWFETGTEGVHWILTRDGLEGYESMVILKEGDLLEVFPDDVRGEAGCRVKIVCDMKVGWLAYPNNPEYGQPCALGWWIHWTQKGWEPDTWARLFIPENGKKPRRAVLTRRVWPR